jgi:hypothetical protein
MQMTGRPDVVPVADDLVIFVSPVGVLVGAVTVART